MYVIVTGSRYWTGRNIIRQALQDLPPDTTVIHGEARGADSIADEEARALGLNVIPVPARWDVHKRAAGPIRNMKMLRMLLRARKFTGQEIKVLAFHEDPKLGRGTRHMVSRALHAGVSVEKFINPLGPIC